MTRDKSRFQTPFLPRPLPGYALHHRLLTAARYVSLVREKGDVMKISAFIAGTAAAASLALAAPAFAQQPAQQQSAQASLVNAMRTIGAAWSRIAQTGAVFITQCPAGGFAAYRLAPRSSTAIDLRQTNSLLNPYIGIVSITGEFQRNSSRQNGACHPTVEAAQSRTDFWGNDMSYDFQLTYHSDGKALSLASADTRFMNGGGNALLRVTAGTHPDWGVALSTPLK